MGALIDRVDGARATGSCGVWVDGLAYGGRRLLGGQPLPWHDTAASVAFFGQCDRLLRSDVQWLPVADFLHQRVGREAALRAAMAARSRAGYALKTLLADEPARRALAELLQALARQSTAPVLLVLPEAAGWLATAHALAHGEPSPPQPEDGERAAMYVADFLRSLAEAAPGGLLVDARAVSDGAPDPHGPLINQARHYRWDCVLLGGPEAWAASGYDLWLGPGARGAWLEALDTPLPVADVYLQHIPPLAEPEPVLERLAQLRCGGR